MKKAYEGIPKEVIEEVEHMDKTGVPRCMHCKKNYNKIEEESSKYHSTWRPNCKCLKKNINLSIG